MKRRPPRSTRTDTLFPYTTLFRSTEFMIRGRGYLRGPADLSGIVLKASDGTPVRLSDVARVEIGPDERRGITELNRSEEHTSELQSLMRISYAVFCLKKKKTNKNKLTIH